MRLSLLPFMAVLAAGILADVYIYRRMRHNGVRRGWCAAHAIVAVVASISLAAVLFMPKGDGGEVFLRSLMWTLFSYFSLYLPKYIFMAFSLVGRVVGRLMHRRNTWIGLSGAVLGAVVFGSVWWGALAGRFDTEIKTVEIAVDDLPDVFDGYRIVQISDLHVGSYGGDTSYLSALVDTVNSLRADAVVFTGDLVNRRSAELTPCMGVLSRLRAPHGVWSVMGNHDYGDYYRWPSESAHRADADSLKAMQARMGWRMLNNEHVWLRRGADSVALIGVENIGDPPFKSYGDFSAAYPDPADRTVKILLSHNPMHWADSIADNPRTNVALTLSGHTHAMQMIFFGWSPASLRYPTWGGLYADTDGHRQLYVNIGIGEVALPARIGSARPEVTLITLRKK